SVPARKPSEITFHPATPTASTARASITMFRAPISLSFESTMKFLARLFCKHVVIINGQQIDQRKDEHPHQVDKVPVEPADFHVFFHLLDSRHHDAQIADAGQDVKHVKAGDAEECRTKQRGRTGPFT